MKGDEGLEEKYQEGAKSISDSKYADEGWKRVEKDVEEVDVDDPQYDEERVMGKNIDEEVSVTEEFTNRFLMMKLLLLSLQEGKIGIA